MSITLPIFKDPILVLENSKERSSENRVLFFIKGGKFAKVSDNSRARLEFRRILDTNECLIAIHEYEPSLPWFIYSITQARIHLIVMSLFGLETKILAKTLDSKYLEDRTMRIQEK